MDREQVLVVDYGSQYTQLIARRVRELEVYCEIVPPWVDLEWVRAFQPSAVVLSGGPGSVVEEAATELLAELLALQVPVLGICYGQQLLVEHFGGRVERAAAHEYGRADLDLAAGEPLFEGVASPTRVWMSHGDRVSGLPGELLAVGTSENSPFAAIRHRERPIFGLQFHPEVAHTREGLRILRNFLIRIAGLSATWTMEDFIERQTREIQSRVGDASVLCGVSGGVDSSVVAALCERALGPRLHCIFIDNGLLRTGEVEAVERAFEGELGIPLETLDAAGLFLERLSGVEDPEKKRVVIGHTFIEVFERAARRHPDARFLAQGTLYPDVIESLSVHGPSATIKTHHNVGGLPERMHLELVEPLRALFKDEVRRLAATLGIPEALYMRQPFPGPGLAVRIVGEVTPSRLERLRAADRIALEEIRAAGWDSRLWQAFCVFLPLRSVGVMGDARTYEHAICLRCVESDDAMTADWAPLPAELLARISGRIINEVRGVNRVVYDISSKPPATIEWE